MIDVTAKLPTTYVVRDIAERYAVDQSKVRTWIRSGELRAIDVSTNCGGRPRYRITPSGLAEFEAKRAVVPPTKAKRRSATGWTPQYFTN